MKSNYKPWKNYTQEDHDKKLDPSMEHAKRVQRTLAGKEADKKKGMRFEERNDRRELKQLDNAQSNQKYEKRYETLYDRLDKKKK